MNDFNIILILIGAAAIFILTVIYIWNVFFWRSWGRVINLILRVFDANDNLVDPDKKIEPDMSASRSDALKAKAESLEAVPLNPMDFVPQKAAIPEGENQQFNETTSDSGWPRALSEEERQDPRPFRNVHIGTDNEAASQANE